VDQLFRYDELYFWPAEGKFDVAKVGAAIRAIGFTFQDEADPAMFVVCPDEECRQKFSASRRANPKAGFPYMLLIDVRADRIRLNQFAGPAFYDYSRQFMTWLKENYAIRVTDESENDLTPLLSQAPAAT
jgi:hypothetical protein